MKEFIESNNYQNAISDIQKIAKISIYPIYPASLIELDKQKLEKSGATLADIEALLVEHFELVVKYSLEKLKKYDNLKIEQEYPSGEEPGEDDEDSDEISQGYSKGFLLINLIEIFLLKYNQEYLINYLKSIRIPKAENYADELKSIYRSLVSHS